MSSVNWNDVSLVLVSIAESPSKYRYVVAEALARFGRNDFRRALRDRADRARRIDTHGPRHRRAVAHVQVLVTEHFARVIDYTGVGGVAHVAAAQRMRRHQIVQERPRRRHER